MKYTLLGLLILGASASSTYGSEGESGNWRDALGRLFESDYKKIARYVLQRVDGIYAQGTQEHDGKPCSVMFSRDSEGKQVVKFDYEPKNPSKFADRFGSEVVAAYKFHGTLGMSIEDLGLNFNPLKIARRIYPSEDFETIRFYTVGGWDPGGLVRCNIDLDAPRHLIP